MCIETVDGTGSRPHYRPGGAPEGVDEVPQKERCRRKKRSGSTG